MKFLAVAILIAATGVMGQNPYEYVDDALIQKVGQIVYEYDQKVAASRGAGGNTNFDAPMPAARNVNYNQYQNMKPQTNYQAPANYKYNNNMNNNMNAKRVNTYSQPQQFKQDTMFQASSNQQYKYDNKPVARSVQQPFVQQQPQNNFQQYQQPMYQNFRNQRQFVAQAPQVQTYQQKPQAQTYQQKPQAQTYQQKPQTYNQQPQFNQAPQQKNFGGFGYTLSQPEAIPMVAEFHETMGQESGFGQDAYKIDGYNNNNKNYRF